MSRKLFLLFALVIAGCSRGVGQSELPGQYEFSLDNMKQQVTVGTDGKYANTFYRNGALVWSDQGTWTYEESVGKKGVAFAQFRFGIPEYSSNRGLWFVVPEKTFIGVKELCFDSDMDRCFQSTRGQSQIGEKPKGPWSIYFARKDTLIINANLAPYRWPLIVL